MSAADRRHTKLALSTWRRSKELASEPDSRVLVNGYSISIADVVAVARHGQQTKLDDSPTTVAKINDSVACLNRLIEQDQVFYGVSTGFGGSADTRSADTAALQVSALQHQQCGILSGLPLGSRNGNSYDQRDATYMPDSWVRATTLIRCNSLVRGHSAVRYHTIQMLETLLNRGYTPLVPIRGSISASGDLSPLSYIAGVLEGNPRLFLWTERDGARTLVSANEALKELQLEPIAFGPKEALGLLNGTAVSAATAALALNEIHQLAILSQMLTAMAVEALSGSTESFHPFLAEIRPHPGQIESAHNISAFLDGSKLAQDRIPANLRNSGTLCQDRYPLRTSTQWVGPSLEGLELAHQQVTIELNSTTDNPVLDTEEGRVFQGGNFQAAAITTAMDQSRSALQMMGKMLFAQCTEMLNASMSKGLPPNLVFDEPSVSFSFKGIDIAMAAYTSELGFLAHPVGPHVQSAEMANQAINSLAFLSARYTHTAIDTFSMLCASYLYCLCQALDLRVMQTRFQAKMRLPLQRLVEDSFGAIISQNSLQELQSLVWSEFTDQFAATTTKDSVTRFEFIAETIQATFMTFFTKTKPLASKSLPAAFAAIPRWVNLASALMFKYFHEARRETASNSDTASYLGTAARQVYNHVRVKLEIPLNRGLVDHPSVAKAAGTKREGAETNPADAPSHDKGTIGDYISQIYDSLRSGDLMDTVMQCVADHHDASNGVASVTGTKSVNGANGHRNNNT